MRHKILSVRGTNSSGKTTVMNRLMALMVHHRDYTTKNGVFTHIYLTADGRHVAFIGKYDGGGTTGGADRVRNIRDVIEAIAEVSEYADVCVESMILSGLQTLTGEIAYASVAHADLYTLFLTTPVDVCIADTQTRRAAAGNTKPFNPENLISKAHAVNLAYKKFESWGWSPERLDREEAFQRCRELLGI